MTDFTNVLLNETAAYLGKSPDDIRQLVFEEKDGNPVLKDNANDVVKGLFSEKVDSFNQKYEKVKADQFGAGQRKLDESVRQNIKELGYTGNEEKLSEYVVNALNHFKGQVNENKVKEAVEDFKTKWMEENKAKEIKVLPSWDEIKQMDDFIRYTQSEKDRFDKLSNQYQKQVEDIKSNHANELMMQELYRDTEDFLNDFGKNRVVLNSNIDRLAKQGFFNSVAEGRKFKKVDGQWIPLKLNTDGNWEREVDGNHNPVSINDLRKKHYGTFFVNQETKKSVGGETFKESGNNGQVKREEHILNNNNLSEAEKILAMMDS